MTPPAASDRKTAVPRARETLKSNREGKKNKQTNNEEHKEAKTTSS
jgi:hypothetical protein